MCQSIFSIPFDTSPKHGFGKLCGFQREQIFFMAKYSKKQGVSEYKITLREIGFSSCAHSTSIFCTVVALTKKVERSYYFYSYHDSSLDFFVYSVVVTKVDD